MDLKKFLELYEGIKDLQKENKELKEIVSIINQYGRYKDGVFSLVIIEGSNFVGKLEEVFK